MSENFKPGDVIVRAGARGIVTTSGLQGEAGAAYVEFGDGNTLIMGEVGDARRLVVIDPEDREQVERLLANYHGWRWARERSEASIGDMQTSLREFANPTPPKPDEPTGLGAVVEDADGAKWVRARDESYPWRPANEALTLSTSGVYRPYVEIAAVRVLSEGVTA